MKVVWTDEADNDLKTLAEYIAIRSPTTAESTIRRLMLAADALGDFPQLGRIVAEFDSPRVREILEHPYRIIYAITPSAIEILAVIHGSRDHKNRSGD